MPKEYKRKRLMEEQSLDTKPRKLGIEVEGSERQRAKKIIRKELDKEWQREMKKKNRD